MGAGPLIGGVAIEYVNWRYIFVAPLPLLFLAFIFGNIVMPKSKTSKTLTFDWLGMFFITLCLSSFLAAIADGQRQGWDSNYILSLFIISFLTALSFIYTQINRKNRLLDFRLFKNKVYFCGILIASKLNLNFLVLSTHTVRPKNRGRFPSILSRPTTKIGLQLIGTIEQTHIYWWLMVMAISTMSSHNCLWKPMVCGIPKSRKNQFKNGY